MVPPQRVDAMATAVTMVVVLMVSAVVPVAATVSGGAATGHRQHPPATSARASPSRAPSVLAWGHWGQKRSQEDALPRNPGASTPQDEERATGAWPQQQVQDSTWTHAAFRAFHEMRAGSPPPDTAGGDGAEEGDTGRGVGTGSMAGVRRLTSSSHSRRSRDSSGKTETAAVSAPTDGDGRNARDSNRKKSHPDAASARRQADREAGEPRGEARKYSSRDSPAACWHMQGRLTNTATGQTIALVEGVELARSLTFEDANSKTASTADRRQKRPWRGEGVAGGAAEGVPARPSREGMSIGEDELSGGELEVDKELKPGMWTAFGALASSKFFMYKDPESGEPMEHFRNTPVEKKQAVRTYERFSQIVSHLLRPNGRILVVSEWGGRFVKAETANSNGVEEVDGGGGGFFSSGAAGGRRLSSTKDDSSSSSPRRVFNLHFFVEARTPKEEREFKRWQERPGARWIALGSPPPRAHGCKEVYSYITGREGSGHTGDGELGGESRGEDEGRGKSRLPWFGNGKGSAQPRERATAGGGAKTRSSTGSSSPSSLSSPRRGGGGGGAGALMSYTRYGECPTWYGTGRMCGLDVQAKRVDSFAALPAKLRKQVLEVDPEFEAGPPGTMEEVRRAAREQRLEREEEARRRGKRSLRRPFGSLGSSSAPAAARPSSTREL